MVDVRVRATFLVGPLREALQAGTAFLLPGRSGFTFTGRVMRLAGPRIQS